MKIEFEQKLENLINAEKFPSFFLSCMIGARHKSASKRERETIMKEK
jgi:hypothetical protein